MTVTTESQVELPAWAVKSGDVVWSDEANDWRQTEEVQHTYSVLGSIVVLIFSRRPRDFMLVQTRDKVRVAL